MPQEPPNAMWNPRCAARLLWARELDRCFKQLAATFVWISKIVYSKIVYCKDRYLKRPLLLKTASPKSAINFAEACYSAAANPVAAAQAGSSIPAAVDRT